MEGGVWSCAAAGKTSAANSVGIKMTNARTAPRNLNRTSDTDGCKPTPTAEK